MDGYSNDATPQLTMSPASPSCTIVIPARNAGDYLPKTLGAIAAAMPAGWEVIVVDDGSQDSTGAIAEIHGVRLIRLAEESGAANARNIGVSIAEHEILIFLDADVLVHSNTLSQLGEALVAEGAPDAVFGSYDASPAWNSTVSQFRNLLHHFMHQQEGRGPASTFWSGCGAIRKEVFHAVGGFRPAGLCLMEDIDLGYRLNDAGYAVELRPEIQCRHLKRWTLASMIRTDIFKRAVPWTVMQLQRRRGESKLNIAPRERLSAAVVGFGLMLPVVAVIYRGSPGVLVTCATLGVGVLVALIGMQREFYGFLVRTRGFAFAMAAVPFHVIYYVCALVGACVGVIVWMLQIGWRGVDGDCSRRE